MAEVTDLQGGVVYLAAPASDYMTGHDLVIDGGFCGLESTTVVSMEEDYPTVIREGMGDIGLFA